MGSASDWHAFLDEYRTFGGKAENVMQRKGAFGMGLFPIDPSKPIDLFVPDELLVPTEDMEFNDGDVVIKDESAFPAGYGDWFRRYQAKYSWGAEGRANTLNFEQGLKELPQDVLNILKRNGVYNPDNRLPGDDLEKELLQRFIQTRCINRKDRRVIMPMIELLNHSPAAKGYEMRENGISVSGMYDGEILVKYSVLDPMRRLIGYGFNAPEPMAFSMSFRLQHREHTFIVQGGGSRTPLKPCQIEFREQNYIIKQPLLGAAKTPKLPRTLFIQACRALNLDWIDAGELFEQIHQRNTLILVNILRELKEKEDYNNVGDLLRTGCLDQLLALSQHYGQRDDLLSQASTSEQES